MLRIHRLVPRLAFPYNPATPLSLGSGTRLGPYEVIAQIGAGGMGEVYRARDIKLNRDVALKVLPEAFAADADRLARFKREAQVLASLNHPHIAAIYGFEDSGSTHALVLELVEGPTLADRIAKGAIPLDEALPIAKQIAEALEAAHEQGIIHRDLKPANIKVRDDGTVKVLDFGLAKAMEPASAISPMLTNSPTITTPAMVTGVGTLLGTAAYMSPEQAKGRPADKRSDVWAFGCVLFELLTGKRAFDGEDVSDTLAAVLRGEPDWMALPSQTPMAVRRFVRGCLDKDRRRRIADISTARFAFDEASMMTDARPTVAPDAGTRWRIAAVAIAAMIVGAALAVAATWMLRRNVRPPAPVARFSITIDGRILRGGRSASISPDGTKIAYVTDRLFVRSLSEASARPLEGTEVSNNPIISPTFSPDSKWIVFWAGEGSLAKGELKKIAVDGGLVQSITTASFPFGISWGDDGIVYSQLIPSSGPTGILRVLPNGGKPEQLLALKPDEAAIEPQMLPGQNALLFTYASGRLSGAPDLAYWDQSRIVVQSLSTGQRTVVVNGGSGGRYLPTGHVVYTVGTRLLATPFDVKRQQTTGAAVPLLDHVVRPALGTTGDAPLGNALFSVSDTGSLIYVATDQQTSGVPTTVLALMNRKGETELLKLPPGPYEHPRVAPNGKRIVYDTDDGTDATVWTYDLSGSTSPLRITFGGRSRYPIWTPDGQRIAFQSTRDGDAGIFWQQADGSGIAEPLTKPPRQFSDEPEAWSLHGDVLLFARSGPKQSLQTLSVEDKKVTLFGDVDVLAAPIPPSASFSPDGRWVAYSVGEGGTPPRVYVRPFPATRAKYQIADNTLFPVWSRDGNAIFHMSSSVGGVLNRMNGVTLSTQPTFAFGQPTAVEMTRQSSTLTPTRNYDVLADGRFIFLASPSNQAAPAANSQIQIVLNWFEELKQRVPSK
jgi:serine/threonine-protein kinase